MADQIIKATKLDENGKPIVPAAPISGTAPSVSAKAPPRFLREGDSRVIPLEWPLEFEGAEYFQLTVGRLRGRAFKRMRELSAVGGHDTDDIALACMTGAPIEVIEALDADDYSNLQEASVDFFPKGLMAKAAKLQEEQEQTESSNAPASSEDGDSNSQTGPNTQPSSQQS